MKKTVKTKRRQSGFTLIELLAVITITGVVGSLMFGVLFATLQGANKSDSSTTIQQNGNFVLAQMSRMIRYAINLEDPASCYSSSPTPTPIQQTSVTVLNADNLTTTFACDTTAGTIASNGANLLDQNSVAVTACTFTCTQSSPYSSPTVSISFTLNKKNSNELAENNSPITFNSTVILRNVK